MYFGDALLYRVRRVTTEEEGTETSRRRTDQARRSSRSRRIVQIGLAFIVVIMAVDALVGERGFMAMLRARTRYAEVSLALARQKAENAKLREEARRLRDDPSAIEELARRNLGLIRPGEKVFIVKDLASPVRQ
jgi:cell division protein FtsB